MRTHARTVDALLKEQGIAIGDIDFTHPPVGSRLTTTADKPLALEVRHARPVVLENDRTGSWLFTAETTPQNMLAQAGLSIFPGDLLIVDGLPQSVPGLPASDAPNRLAIRPAYTIELMLNGDAQTLHSGAPTLGEALWEHGIVLYAGDRLTPDAETALHGVIQAELIRSSPLRIVSADTELRSRSSAETVGGALRQAGLTLQGLDYTIPGEDKPLPTDGRIRVVRVEERIEVEMEPLAFQTLYQPMPDVEIDNQQILQRGSYGVQANRVRIRLEDGEEIDRAAQGDWVAKEPVDQIVGYGINIMVRSIDTDDGSLE